MHTIHFTNSNLDRCKLEACQKGSTTINFRNGVCEIHNCSLQALAPTAIGWDIYSLNFNSTKAVGVAGSVGSGWPGWVIAVIAASVSAVVLVMIIAIVVIVCRKKRNPRIEGGTNTTVTSSNVTGTTATTGDGCTLATEMQSRPRNCDDIRRPPQNDVAGPEETLNRDPLPDSKYQHLVDLYEDPAAAYERLDE